jgi:hypothetical protein
MQSCSDKHDDRLDSIIELASNRKLSLLDEEMTAGI